MNPASVTRRIEKPTLVDGVPAVRARTVEIVAAIGGFTVEAS